MMKTRVIISLIVLIAAFTSCMAQKVATTTYYVFLNGIETDSIDASDSLIIDGAAILKFRSTAAGTHTLYEITTKITGLQVLSSALFDSIYRHTDTLQIHNLRLIDLESAIASTDSAWISTTTDTVFLRTTANSIYASTGDPTVYIKVNDEISAYFGTGTVTGGPLGIGNALAFNLGSDVIISTSTNGDTLKFKDNVTGWKTLAELAAGGVGGDTLVVDSVAHMLSDSLCFPFGLGSRLSTDTMLMHDGSYMGGWYNEQDTCVSLKTRYKAFGAGASIPFRILSGDSIDIASPTVILDATATTVMQETSTYTNNKTPRDKKIWCEINGEPSTSGVMILVDHEVAYTRY